MTTASWLPPRAGTSVDDVQRVAADAAGVPAGAVRAVTVTELPMLSSGKPDYQAVRALARDADAAEAGVIDLRAVVADVLHARPRHRRSRRQLH